MSSQIAISFVYPSNFSGVAVVNTTAVDTNGYSYSTPTNITVYNYTAPSTTLLTTQAFIHNQSYLLQINSGTSPVKYIEVFWGDGTETTVLNSSFVNSEAILYHTYSIAPFQGSFGDTLTTVGFVNDWTLSVGFLCKA